MKSKIIAKTTILATLLGLAQVAHAEATAQSFTPLEELPPEQRLAIQSQLDDLEGAREIEWDNTVVGVNENGEIAFRQKSEVQLHELGTFSTVQGLAAEPQDK